MERENEVTAGGQWATKNAMGVKKSELSNKCF